MSIFAQLSRARQQHAGRLLRDSDKEDHLHKPMTRISLFHRCAYATLTKSTFDDSRRRGARQFVEATFFALTTHLDGVFLRSRSFSTEATNNDSNAALRVWNARYQGA